MDAVGLVTAYWVQPHRQSARLLIERLQVQWSRFQSGIPGVRQHWCRSTRPEPEIFHTAHPHREWTQARLLSAPA